MKQLIPIFVLVLIASAFSFCTAFAQDVVQPQDFFAQVMAAMQSFGGLSTMAKISSVILLLVASMKVSFLKSLIWDKLGAAQAWVGPLLGLIAGVLGIGNGGAPITLASVMAYAAAGGGAVLLHELLDSVKVLPGIGSVYVSIINVIEGALGGSAPKA